MSVLRGREFLTFAMQSCCSPCAHPSIEILKAVHHHSHADLLEVFDTNPLKCFGDFGNVVHKSSFEHEVRYQPLIRDRFRSPKIQNTGSSDPTGRKGGGGENIDARVFQYTMENRFILLTRPLDEQHKTTVDISLAILDAHQQCVIHQGAKRVGQ